MRPLLRLLVTAASLWVAVRIVPGLSFHGGVIAFLGVAAVFAVVNAVVRPLTLLLSLPLLLVTLGLFWLVVNGLMLWLTAALSSALGLGFEVRGLWAAVLGGLVVSLASWILDRIATRAERSALRPG
ncbi:MAG TPA: phage holin family protein [Anaeromyxobacteraceae bacterium]|nr:phage holin family protein [Anaeromyxobacteraceae bacterium]